ncbi:tenascin-like [Anneissia japonica]|uniref:tenascin-like n=1 Tax=Anneissia japonica TaxID=1529436 RepID=UPI0014257D64|nr:tenascin-like [Anneissia japonica]
MELYKIFISTLLFWQTQGINSQTSPGVNEDATCNFTLDKIPDITASSTSFIVDDNNEIDMRAYTGMEDGNNFNVMFGIGLWVDDNGTHYGENELVNLDNNHDDSIFTSGTTYNECIATMIAFIRCRLKFPPVVAVRRIGVKYMWTEFKGCIASASMVFLAKNATVVPEHRTITTSIGETVHLVMTHNGVNASKLRWKKDGGSDIMEWEGLSNVNLENVRKKDAGIYECYPEGQRHFGQHAILRLFVRACGNNKLGRDCTIICSSTNPGCPGVLFCPPDPFGCSCMSGYGDLYCESVCDTGTTGKYGPGCLLDCHCDANECQPSEGCNTNVTCHSGYTGTRCLERDPNVECPVGYYGPQCTKICHCQISLNCDRNNGSCPNGNVCEEGWAGAGCQQVLPALSDAPLVVAFANNVNIRWSTWSLDNDYGRGTVHSYQLEYWPTNDASDLVVLNITMGTEMNILWSQMNYNTEYSFTVKVVTEVEGVLVSGKASPLAEILSRLTTTTSYEERQTTESTTAKVTTVPLTSGAKGQTTVSRLTTTTSYEERQTTESTTAKVTTVPLTSGAKGQTTESTTAKVMTVPLTSGAKGQTTVSRLTTTTSYEERQTTESTTAKVTTVPLTSGAKGQTTESTTAKVTTVPLTSGAKGQTTESTTAKITTVPLTSGAKGQTTESTTAKVTTVPLMSGAKGQTIESTTAKVTTVPLTLGAKGQTTVSRLTTTTSYEERQTTESTTAKVTTVPLTSGAKAQTTELTTAKVTTVPLTSGAKGQTTESTMAKVTTVPLTSGAKGQTTESTTAKVTTVPLTSGAKGQTTVSRLTTTTSYEERQTTESTTAKITTVPLTSGAKGQTTESTTAKITTVPLTSGAKAQTTESTTAKVTTVPLTSGAKGQTTVSRLTTTTSYEERQTTESTTAKVTTVPLTSGAKGQTTESTTAKVTTVPMTSGAKGQTTESTTAKITTVPLTSGAKGQTTGM